MINYIICNSSEKGVNFYKKIIHNYMNNKNEEYNIYLFSKININMCGKKIFIFDDDSMNTIDIAKNIRYEGDYNSQIIIILKKNNYSKYNLLKLKKLFMLDIIFKDSDWTDKINMYLDIDYNIINSNKSLCFKYCNNIFHILYSDICYIEKNLCDNDSTIVTRDNKYIINLSINRIMELLNNDNRFYKCHRSCIVNIDNIISYDKSNNIINFKNDNISLISRDRKKELESILLNKL